MEDMKECELLSRARAISVHFPQAISQLISAYDYNFRGELDHEMSEIHFSNWSSQHVCGLSGGRLIVNAYNNVEIWDGDPKLNQRLWQMMLVKVESIRVLQNGMFMVHSGTQTKRGWRVRLFDANTFKFLARFPAQRCVEVLQRDEADEENDTTRIVTFLHRSERFELVSFKRSGPGGATTRQMTSLGEGSAISCLSVLPDNKFVFTTARKLFGFQCVGGQVVKLNEFLSLEDGVTDVASVVSTDGMLLIFGCDNESRQGEQQGYLLVVEDMKITKKLFVDAIVNRAVFLSSSRLLCFSDEIWVLNLITGVRELTLCKQFSGARNHFALLPDGQLAVSSMCACSAKDIDIYDTATGVISHTIHVSPQACQFPKHVSVSACTPRIDRSGEMAVLPDGRLACPGAGSLKIYK